jgi:hypothetical protein
MAGKKTLAKNQPGDKRPDNLTQRVCARCGERMLAKKIRATLSINFVGERASKGFIHHHAKCA